MPIAVARGAVRRVAGAVRSGMQLRSRVKKEEMAVAVATAPPSRSRSTKRAAEGEQEPAVKVEVTAATPSRRTRQRVKEEPLTLDAAVASVEGDCIVVKKEADKKKKKKQKTKGKAKQRAVRAEPAAWRAQLEGIEAMRAKKDAEVDAYGCEVFFDPKRYPGHVARFHVLIAAMLSSQTKDPVNAAAMGRLIAHGLTVQDMLDIDEKELAQIIRPVGFFNNKAKYIKQTAVILKERASGEDVIDIPDTYESLIALPGVGPKMATLVMSCAWNNTVGICVDTHVHRISNRLKWVNTWNSTNPKSQDPEKTRAELEDWLPREYWAPINPLLVGFGQTICLPIGPKCDECKIKAICPSAHKKTL